MGIKIAIWVCHQGAMRYMWQLVGHLVLPKGTAPDENSSFDAHAYWELLHVCYGFFLHQSCRLNAIVMLRFGPSLAFDKFKFLGASDVMHHATTVVLWLQCPISFILCCVHVWANLMPYGHQNSNLSLSPGYDELHVATGWALNVAQGHGPGWELEFWCPWILRIVACMLWNLST